MKTCPVTNIECKTIQPTRPMTGTEMKRPRYIFSYNPEEAEARRNSHLQPTVIQ